MYKQQSKKMKAYAQGDFTKTPETALTKYFPYYLEKMWKESGQFKYRSRQDFLNNLKNQKFPSGLTANNYDPNYKFWFGKHKGSNVTSIDKKYLTWAALTYWDEHPRLREHCLYALDGYLEL